MTAQIFWGSLVLGICSAVHLALIVLWIGLLKPQSNRISSRSRLLRIAFPIFGTFALIILSHTIQVWIWAGSLVALKALPNFFDAIYFSLVTYTTVGYGDVTLSSEYKLFGAMAAVTGLLNFGVSTAFLVGVLGKALPDHLR